MKWHSLSVSTLLVIAVLTLARHPAGAATVTPEKPNDPYFAKFYPFPAPATGSLLLRQNDRLAIIGDSITEQKMYSRIMETYLTVCVPELNITARQYGWSGERAPGFLARMTNDCLRFNPTIATTCYGMNDHEYKPYEDRIGKTYFEKSTAIVNAFKEHGVRVVHGSPGPVGKMPGWVKTASGTVEDLNLNLCNLRNIGVEIAREEKVGFADVFWPMFSAAFHAQQKYGTNFAVAGNDGVHPGWAGQVIMAHAFLKALGLKGDIGTYTVDLKSGKATVTAGHALVSSKPGEVRIQSTRYPFCAPPGDLTTNNNIRAGMALVPFNEDLNRLILVAKNGSAKSYKVTWGPTTKSYSAQQLAKGVNLAADFALNPFSDAFKKVDEAVYAKQAYETTQIKKSFRSPEAKANMEAVVAKTEAERAPLAAAIKSALVPVTHTVTLTAE
jgi:lysophospholipase L1-like esterase